MRAAKAVAFPQRRDFVQQPSAPAPLTWGEVHIDRKEIERVTQKRTKKVIIPIQSDLLAVLDMEQIRRNPKPGDPVLLNPVENTPMSRKRLYHRMLALGKRAGVLNAHPHRFRDTFALDMLARGASPYDVAKLLGGHHRDGRNPLYRVR